MVAARTFFSRQLCQVQVIAMGSLKDLTGNQMFVSRQITSQNPPLKAFPIYISWYINDYRCSLGR